MRAKAQSLKNIDQLAYAETEKRGVYEVVGDN